MIERFTSLRAAVSAGVVLSMVAVSTAGATHVFDDVPDDEFYADPVEWASTNMITTGTGPTTFDPERDVTRGESVTFLKRYDDNIVQPALSAIPRFYTARVASTGLLLRGSPGVKSEQISNGTYNVTFPVDVLDCNWQATPTAAGGLLFFVDAMEIFATVTGGQVGILPPTPDRDLVTVRIFDEDGLPQDWRFDLLVAC